MANFISICLFVYSLKYISLSMATTIVFIHPIVIALMIRISDYKKTLKYEIIGVLLAVIGLLIIVISKASVYEQLTLYSEDYSIYGQISAFLSGISMTIRYLIKRRFIRKMHSLVPGIFTGFLSSLLSPFLFIFKGKLTQHSVVDILLLIVTGILGYMGSYFLTGAKKIALKRNDLDRSALRTRRAFGKLEATVNTFCYTQVVLAIIMDRWVLHIKLTATEMIAVILIVQSNFMICLRLIFKK